MQINLVFKSLNNNTTEYVILYMETEILDMKELSEHPMTLPTYSRAASVR
jgi:hypothetical protein